MCKKLAREGFNICIVARNEEKMKEKLKELENLQMKADLQSAKVSQTPPKIETMYIVADFAKMFTIQDYQSIVADKLQGIDIGILALNAGIAS